MRTRPFGKTGDSVSEPGLGTTFMARQGQDGVNSRIAQSMDQGITDFDTAAAYEKGNNERMLGIALRGRRDKASLATKVGGVEELGGHSNMEAFGC